MDKIQPGKYVEIAYNLYASLPGQPETMVHTVEASEPERFIYGVTPGLIAALAAAIDGLEQGASFDVKSSPPTPSPITPTTWPPLTATSSSTTTASSTHASRKEPKCPCSQPTATK